MAADQPTILAASGGFRQGQRVGLEFNHLTHHAVDLAGTTGRRPRVTYVGSVDAIAVEEPLEARLLGSIQ